MVKIRKLAIPYPTVFIFQLPEPTQRIIRKDLEQYAAENGYHLEWNPKNNDYIAMAGRFSDLEMIYQHTILHFCQP